MQRSWLTDCYGVVRSLTCARIVSSRQVERAEKARSEEERKTRDDRKEGCAQKVPREHESVARIKFPTYWKIRDAKHVSLFHNCVLKDRLQMLIRESVRPACRNRCMGRDGDASGAKTAEVTKVLRIENGPLWERYCERKREMLARIGHQRVYRLKARSMDRFCDIFKSVKVEEKINELFLLHGTREECGKLVAKEGFDPSQSNKLSLYGAGIYFSENSCKALQYAPQTRAGERVLIICRVLMGNSYNTNNSLQGHREPPEVEGKRFDSVFAQEGKGNKKRQKHNEYITYSADQVYPEYLVYMRLEAISEPTGEGVYDGKGKSESESESDEWDRAWDDGAEDLGFKSRHKKDDAPRRPKAVKAERSSAISTECTFSEVAESRGICKICSKEVTEMEINEEKASHTRNHQ